MKLKFLVLEVLKWFYLKCLEIVIRRNFLYLEILTLNFSRNQEAKRSLLYFVWKKGSYVNFEVLFVRVT